MTAILKTVAIALIVLMAAILMAEMISQKRLDTAQEHYRWCGAYAKDNVDACLKAL